MPRCRSSSIRAAPARWPRSMWSRPDAPRSSRDFAAVADALVGHSLRGPFPHVGFAVVSAPPVLSKDGAAAKGVEGLRTRPRPGTGIGDPRCGGPAHAPSHLLLACSAPAVGDKLAGVADAREELLPGSRRRGLLVRLRLSRIQRDVVDAPDLPLALRRLVDDAEGYLRVDGLFHR